MSQRKPLVFELLNKQHERAAFDCGVAILNTYLKTRSSQELRRHIAFPYVMTFKGETSIKGYYTLSAASVPLNQLPDDIAKQTRYEFVPAVLIGRLAVDHSLHGQGYGQLLLVDALRRIARSKDFAVMLVIVEAKNQGAADFYARFGFMDLAGDGKHLFLPFKTIADL